MNILVVDNDPLTLNVVNRAHDESDYSITSCDDSYKALSLFEKNNYDLILCEACMPQLSALMLANLLKEHHSQAVPIILMSSERNIEQFIQRQFGPGFDCIRKPISFQHLVKAIEEIQERQQKSQRNF